MKHRSCAKQAYKHVRKLLIKNHSIRILLPDSGKTLQPYSIKKIFWEKREMTIVNGAYSQVSTVWKKTILVIITYRLISLCLAIEDYICH